MNGEDKVRLTVDIFGNTYKMVGSFSQKYVKQLSAYVNEHMAAIAKSNPRLDTQKVAILALVQMADEYFRLQQQLDNVENERAQSKQHMEQLRKAFELSEEKEQTKSGECRRLEQQVKALEEDRGRLALEMEMAGAAWAERVAEWEMKYERLSKERNQLVRELQDAREEAAASIAAAAQRNVEQEVKEAAPSRSVAEIPAAELSPEEESLAEKYKRLQDEYVKLQNEFNEWIQLTMSETQ